MGRRPDGAKNLMLLQFGKPFNDARKRTNTPFEQDFSVKFLFAEGQLSNLWQEARPIQYIWNDEFVLHPKPFPEMPFRQVESVLLCQTFPAFFVMRRRVDNYSIPIKNRTELHRSSEKYRTAQFEPILSGGANTAIIRT